MFSYVMFPLCVYIPFFLIKRLTCNHKIQCNYEFTIDTDLNRWNTFTLHFNRRNNPYKVVNMVSLIDKFVDKGMINYSDVHVTVDSIDIVISNDFDELSSNVVKDIMNEEMIEFEEHDELIFKYMTSKEKKEDTDTESYTTRISNMVEDINEIREEIVESKDKDV